MHPILFSIGSFHAYGYGAMIGLGAALAIFLSYYRAKKQGLNEDVVFNTGLYGLIIGLLGAKLTFILSNMRDLFENPKYVLGTEGFTVYGGIILGVAFGAWYLNRHDVKISEYMDLMIPQVALAQGFGRIGCFLAGCCYGKETDSALGVIFPPESISPSGVPLWPTQLFSAVGDILIFIILLVISKVFAGKLPPFTITGGYLALYGIGRFAVEFFRADPRKMFLGFSSNQYVSIVYLFLGVLLISFGLYKRKLRETK